MGHSADSKRFAAALKRREELKAVVGAFFHRDEETHLYDHALYHGQWQDLADAWRARFPGRRRTVKQETASAWKALRREAEAGNFPELEEIRADYEALARELFGKVNEARDACQEELACIADRLDVPKGARWIRIGAADESTYSSQGYGAAKYAQSAAEEIADKARLYGLEVEIRKVEAFRWEERHWRGWSQGTRISYRYEVHARTTPTGAEILAYKQGPTLRERVRACWARKVNPRVTMWWLDPDFEEREGLDFFGGEKARAEVA